MRNPNWLMRQITAARVAWGVAMLSGAWCALVLSAAAFFPAPGRKPWLHEFFTMLLAPDAKFPSESFLSGHRIVVLGLFAASCQAIYLSWFKNSPRSQQEGLTRFVMFQTFVMLMLGIGFIDTALAAGQSVSTHRDPTIDFLDACCELFHPTKWHLLWLMVNYLLLGRHMLAGIRAGQWQVTLGLSGMFQGLGVLVSVCYLVYRAKVWGSG